jgi:hypothetical protein
LLQHAVKCVPAAVDLWLAYADAQSPAQPAARHAILAEGWRSNPDSWELALALAHLCEQYPELGDLREYVALGVARWSLLDHIAPAAASNPIDEHQATSGRRSGIVPTPAVAKTLP